MVICLICLLVLSAIGLGSTVGTTPLENMEVLENVDKIRNNSQITLRLRNIHKMYRH